MDSASDKVSADPGDFLAAAPSAGEGSPVVASLAFLIADVAVYGGLVIHTLLSRRRYRPLLEKVEPSAATDFFLELPGAVYAAVFLLFVVGLILKECVIERKAATLRINLAALAGAAGLFGYYLWQIQLPFERLRA